MIGRLSSTRARVGACALLAAIASTALAAPAPARTIVVGSSLEGDFKAGRVKTDGTYVNVALADPEANLVSPVDGAVLSYEVSSVPGSTLRLRVLSPEGGSVYRAKSSTPWWTVGESPHYYDPLKIEAGETIGIDIVAGGALGIATRGPEAAYAGWVPALPAATPLPYVGTKTEREIGFNAVVLPAPTISRIAPKSAPAQESTLVRIHGNDFQQVTDVRIGNLAARSFRVASPHLILAKTPKRGHGARTCIRVETVAGRTEATAACRFEFETPRG